MIRASGPDELSPATDAGPTATFEESMTRLETIVRELEANNPGLDESLRLFEEGIERLRAATSELSRAEARVKLLVEQTDGTFELADFGA